MVAAAGIFGLGAPELILVIVVLLLLFGASRVGDLGGSLGKGIREFRKNIKDEDEVPPAPLATASAPSTNGQAAIGQAEVTSAIKCPNCGTLNPVGARHCNQCGTSIAAPVP